MGFLEQCDADFAEKCRQGGCLHCGAKLHRADYKRSPRDGFSLGQEVYRYSFCCGKEGCRKRHTPASVRFLGRRVYFGYVVVVVSAIRHGLAPGRMQALGERLSIDRRTLERWRAWWLETFVDSAFWKAARARFMPLLCESTLPLSLCEAFEIERKDRLLDLLKYLSPLTCSAFLSKQRF